MPTKIIKILCLCIFLEQVQGIIYEQNITDFSKCKTHVSRSEGKYTEFYEINVDEGPRNDSLVFDFHFSVLGRSDAHVLLAESDVLKRTDPVYEIVIGAGGNTFSDLRRLQKSNGKVSARIKNLLSAIEIRSFWIHIWNDGLIEVGKETDELAFLAWKDSNPLNLRFFSFSTWPGVEAKWYFDCERNIVKGSELILTNYETLTHDLFQDINVFTRPISNDSNMTDVELVLTPQYISLDVSSSRLSIKGPGNMKWQDERLRWNPNDYGNLKLLKLPSHNIWTPDLRVGDYQVKLQDVVLYENGTVVCNIVLDLTYWCNIEDLGSWPADVHNCSLTFHFMRDGEAMRLWYLSEPGDFFVLPSASEWSVVYLDVKYEPFLNEGILEGTTGYVEDEVPKITFFFSLKRTSTIYKSIFFTPLLVISVCTLCTFFVSPIGYLKITLCSIQLLMESVILICISSLMPGHSTTVPILAMAYSYLITSTTILVILSIIVINLSRNNSTKFVPNVIHYIASLNIIRDILLLPARKMENIYGKLSASDISLNEDAEVSSSVLFGMIVDRICFIIYSIFLAVLLIKAY